MEDPSRLNQGLTTSWPAPRCCAHRLPEPPNLRKHVLLRLSDFFSSAVELGSIRLGRDADVEPDLRRPDLPLTAIPAHDDSRGLEPVKRLFNVGRYAILVLSDEVELSPDQAQDPANGRRTFLGDTLLAFGRCRVGSLERKLQRADQPAELPEPVVAEAEVLAVNDVDFTPAHDGGLVNRFEVIFPIVRLKGDVDSLGQVLQRPLYPDLSRI